MLLLKGYLVLLLTIGFNNKIVNGYQWTEGVYNQRMPESGLVGGTAEHSHDNKAFKLYVGRSTHEGEIIPGKILNPTQGPQSTLNGGDCFVIHNGREHWKANFQILSGTDEFTWMSMYPSRKIPHNAIKGGEKSDGTPYYIGRARHDGINNEIGKVDASNKMLYTSIEQKGKTWSNYEILVAKNAAAESGQTNKLTIAY